jgi:hypothetical protein
LNIQDELIAKNPDMGADQATATNAVAFAAGVATVLIGTCLGFQLTLRYFTPDLLVIWRLYRTPRL